MNTAMEFNGTSERLNAIVRSDAELREQLTRTAREAAQMIVARWPQYAGHFDEWRLVRIKRDVKTRMGLAFTKGSWALAAPKLRRIATAGPMAGKLFATVFSWRNEVGTSVNAAHVEWLDGAAPEVEELIV